MTKYVVTVKHGNNGISSIVRDIDTGKVASFDLHGPKEITEVIFKKLIEERADVEIKHE